MCSLFFSFLFLVFHFESNLERKLLEETNDTTNEEENIFTKENEVVDRWQWRRRAAENLAKVVQANSSRKNSIVYLYYVRHFLSLWTCHLIGKIVQGVFAKARWKKKYNSVWKRTTSANGKLMLSKRIVIKLIVNTSTLRWERSVFRF